MTERTQEQTWADTVEALHTKILLLEEALRDISTGFKKDSAFGFLDWDYLKTETKELLEKINGVLDNT